MLDQLRFAWEGVRSWRCNRAIRKHPASVLTDIYRDLIDDIKQNWLLDLEFCAKSKVNHEFFDCKYWGAIAAVNNAIRHTARRFPTLPFPELEAPSDVQERVHRGVSQRSAAILGGKG